MYSDVRSSRGITASNIITDTVHSTERRIVFEEEGADDDDADQIFLTIRLTFG